MKRLANLMLLSNLLCTLFYATSYPYIYAEAVKIIPHFFISLEQILLCLGTIIFCKLWNKYSNRLFKHYKTFLLLEIAADILLFADVLMRQNLSFYFLLNLVIASTITKNLSCGSVKMRAMVNPSEKEREQFDNNSNIVNAIATLIGAGVAIICNIDLQWLFIFAFIGNVVDNVFYLYIYSKIRSDNVIIAKCVKNTGDWCNYPELEVGKEYKVFNIIVSQSCSYIILDGMTRCFNSISFDVFEDGKPLNYIKDKRFNPYLEKINE